MSYEFECSDFELFPLKVTAGGVPVPLEDVPSLEVTVFSTLLTKQEGSTFPTQGEDVHHRHITRGKVGGYRTTAEDEA